MRALVDSDVLIDIALARAPFANDSASVLRWAEAGGAAAVAWHSLSNCAYLLKGGGRPFIERLLLLVEVAPVGTAEARRRRGARSVCRCQIWKTRCKLRQRWLGGPT
jgi:hypothetical protein